MSRSVDDLMFETSAVVEAIDVSASTLGLDTVAVTLGATKYAALATAHTNTTEEEFLDLCRIQFQLARAEMAKGAPLDQTCPPGFRKVMKKHSTPPPAQLAAPKAGLRLVREDG